jgi:glycosyltransferase involved in cell wall biosynthesis
MLRTRLGVPAGRLIFGALGRLNEEKGFSVLVEAAARLIGRGLDIEVWIAGDGPQRSALESQVRGYNIMDRVRFLGFWEQTLDLYAALDGFVLSSVREGLPNVLLEAMAMQIPVVSTRVPGVLELIQDGENGLLVGIRDAAGLADAMARLAVDSALRSRLGAAGRARVEADFDFRRRADIERAAYDRLLMNRSAKHAQWRPTCSALSD